MDTREGRGALPLVGRGEEIALVAERLAQAATGQGQILSVVAEPGLGKSRLVDEATRLATARGFVTVRGEGQPYATLMPYLPWRTLLRAFFGLSERATDWQPLHAQVSALDPAFTERLPLLGPVLNLPIPPTPLTRGMEPTLRKSSLEALLVECVRQRAAISPAPLLFILEDCHWLDALSVDLLEGLARNLADLPLLLLLTYHPPDPDSPSQRLSHLPASTALWLPPLTPDEAAALLALRLVPTFAPAPLALLPAGPALPVGGGLLAPPPAPLSHLLPPKLLDWAQGNPLYLEELAVLLDEWGIGPEEMGVLDQVVLPTGLDDLLQWRFEGLDAAARALVQLASVIGPTFSGAWLQGIRQEEPEAIAAGLAQAAREGLVEPVTGRTGWYRFRHLLTCEAIYHGLEPEARAHLHETVAAFIERAHADAPERWVDWLAFHYQHSANVAKQREALRQAGEAAQRIHATDAALLYFQRLLPLLPTPEQAEVLLHLGRIQKSLGQWVEAERSFREGLARAEESNQPSLRAHALFALANLFIQLGTFGDALVLLDRARQEFERLGESQQVMEVLNQLGHVYWSQGEIAEAIRSHEAQLALAQALQDETHLWRVPLSMGQIHLRGGDDGQALASFHTALERARAAGALETVAYLLGQIGHIHSERRELDRAMSCFTEELQTSLLLGNLHAASHIAVHIGQLYLKRGEYERAFVCCTYLLRYALFLGDRTATSVALILLADIAIARGQYREAERLCKQALALGRALGLRYLFDYLLSCVRLYVLQGRYAEAQPLVLEALHRAAEAGSHPSQLRAQLLGLQIAVALQQMDRATAHQTLLDLLAEWHEPPQQAAIHFELVRLDPTLDLHRTLATHLYQALYTATPSADYRECYETLTGERLPDLPPLPPPPAIVLQAPTPSETLLGRVDELIATLSANWLSFLPPMIAQEIVQHPDLSPVGREQRLEVVALFADVSGFTSLSEALGRVGRRGTEEVTTLLNRYFQPMIETISTFGGHIIKFLGDALLIVFPQSAAAQGATARRAIQCALAMQAQMAQFAALPTSAGTFTLEMKAGLAQGTLFCTTVGDPALKLEAILAGRVLMECYAAEEQGAAGEVVATLDLLRQVPGVQVAREAGGWGWVTGLTPPAQPRLFAPLTGQVSPAVEARLVAFHHPAIAQRLRSGQVALLNEHRRVTMLFLQFDGFDYDHDPDVGAALQSYLREIFRLVQRYNGYLEQVDMGEKGASKFLALWGTPVAHEDDEARALHCALELRAFSERLGIRTCAGLNSGFVFCGLLGSARRRAYSVLGDAVNVAARLMQHAHWGQILVSEATQQAARGIFAWQLLPPVLLKGKTEPVPLYEVLGQAAPQGAWGAEPDADFPLVGREREQAQVVERLARVRAQQGQVITLSGEAGLGKSRLLAEISSLAAARGMLCFRSTCQSFGITTPYLGWHGLLRGLFGFQPGWDEGRQQRFLAEQLRAVEPTWEVHLPLLGVALNLPIPNNQQTRTLDARTRKTTLEALLVAYLRHHATARATPLLLLIDDCHWMDPLSQELAEALARGLADLPVLLVLAGRSTPEERAAGWLHPLTNLPHATALTLRPLAQPEALRLVTLRVEQWLGSGAAPRPAWGAQLIELAQGNPFYLHELVSLLQEQGLDPRETGTLRKVSLPESLHHLILSRLDQLDEATKGTLKLASVIGQSFHAAWLWGAFPDLGTPEQVQDSLDSLQWLELIVPDPLAPPDGYRFRHSAMQEVAYESLPFTMRATLHGQVAAFIERIHAERLEPWVELLAHHYGQSANEGRQRLYLRRAGEAAQAAFANEAALTFYERLLPLLPEMEQGEIVQRMERLCYQMGRWEQAWGLAQRLLAWAEQQADPRALGRAQMALGRLAISLGRPEEARRSLEAARATFTALDDARGLHETLRYLGKWYHEHGRIALALAAHEEALRLATALGDRRGQGWALQAMALVYLHGRDFDSTLAHIEQALSLALELDERPLLSQSYLVFGLVAAMQGQSAQAMAWYAQQLQVAMELEDRADIGMAVQTMGGIYQLHGEWERAQACFVFWLASTLQTGERWGTSLALNGLARIAAVQGRAEEAEALFLRAVRLLRDLDNPSWLSYVLHCLSEFYVSQGRYGEAEELGTEAVRLATAVGRKDILFASHVLAARRCVLAGQWTPQQGVYALEGLMGEWGQMSEQATLAYEAWRLDPAQEGQRQRAAALYHDLHDRTPTFEYRERYQALTGQSLPALTFLPDLPDIVQPQPAQLALLLARMDEGRDAHSSFGR